MRRMRRAATNRDGKTGWIQVDFNVLNRNTATLRPRYSFDIALGRGRMAKLSRSHAASAARMS